MALPNFNDPDYLKGREVLRAFHNASLGFSTYHLTFEGLIQSYPYGVIEGLGLAVNSTSLSVSRYQDAMSDVAKVAKGRLPTASAFFNALQGRAVELRYLDAITEVGSESLKDLGTGLAKTGDAVLAAGKGLLTFAPLILLAGVLVFAYVKGKSPV